MYCLPDLLYIAKRYLHISTALVWNTSIFQSNIFSSETAASFQFPKFRLLSSRSFCFQKESATLHWYWYTSMAITFFLRIFLPVLNSQLGTIPSQIQPPASHITVIPPSSYTTETAPDMSGANGEIYFNSPFIILNLRTLHR